MASDVPLLTQDDFLSHLKLQPVTSCRAAFAYRHALKERLRATTRSQEGGTGSCSLSPRAKAKRIKMAKMYSSSPTRAASGASKRLFSGAPRTDLAKDELVSDEGVNVKSSRAILETLVNNCNMYLHPKVKEEIGSYGLSKMDKRQFIEKATILERNTYLPGSRNLSRDALLVSLHHQPPHTPVKEQGEKQYKCKVLLQSPVSSAKKLQKDKLHMTARVKLTRLSVKKNQQHRTRILIQPKVDLEDVRSRMLPSSVSYPSILPLVVHIERTKEELLERNCDSPLPVYNDPPVRVRKAKKTKSSSSTASNNNKSSEKSSSKDSGVNVDDDEELDLECRICRKKFYSYSGLNKHLLRGHCPVCKAPVNSKGAFVHADSGEKAVSKAKLGAWSICQKCVHSLPLKTTKLLNGNHVVGKEGDHEVACDICTSRFRRRIHMIKHVMTQHASQMHRVDLAKFVAIQPPTVTAVTTSGAAASPWDNEC